MATSIARMTHTEVRVDRTMTLQVSAALAGLVAVMTPTAASSATSLPPVTLQHTSSAMPIAARREDVSVEVALTEIKDGAGLAWKDVAGLLGVTRRALYDWLKGTGISEKNRAAVFALRERVHSMRSDPRFRIRNALLGQDKSGLPERFRTQIEFDEKPLRGSPAKIEKNTLKIVG